MAFSIRPYYIKVMNSRENLTLMAVSKLKKMGLSVFTPGNGYSGDKPDLVAVYPDKGKYYLTEVVSESCIGPESARFKSGRLDEGMRHFCRKLYGEDPRKAAWAVAAYCDLGKASELFAYDSLGDINLKPMQRYGALIHPNSLTREMSLHMTCFGLEFKTLDIMGFFALTLFSQIDTVRLGESRRFMSFLLSNKEL